MYSTSTCMATAMRGGGWQPPSGRFRFGGGGAGAGVGASVAAGGGGALELIRRSVPLVLKSSVRHPHRIVPARRARATSDDAAATARRGGAALRYPGTTAILVTLRPATTRRGAAGCT